MLLAILHYIPDLAEARRIVARLLDAVPSGSYLTISHAASDISPEAMAEMIRRMIIRLIISAIASGEMSLAAMGIVR